MVNNMQNESRVVNYDRRALIRWATLYFMLENYDSRAVIWGIFQSGTTLES